MLRTLCNRAAVAHRRHFVAPSKRPASSIVVGIRALTTTSPTATSSAPTATAATTTATSQLNSAAELEAFMAAFPALLHNVTASVQRYEQPHGTRLAATWLEQAMLYNVPKGKRNRGLLTVSTFRLLQAEQTTAAVDEATALADVQRAQHLGWCVEMLQALFLVADDIMDHSETRRGSPCWYRLPHVGLRAVNDALMLENVMYAELRRHYGVHPAYAQLLELFHEAMLVTCVGESLDLQTAEQPICTFTPDQYTAIVHNKTAFYSFYLPVAAAMLATGRFERTGADAALFEQVRAILYEIGHFFQVQDDYLDCFGDPAVTGKIGTDIEDAKCSWLAVQCVQRATAAQRALLERCYGQRDAEQVAQVRGLYVEMGLPEAYAAYEERSYGEIGERIARLPEAVPRVIFEQIMRVIYRRKH